MSAWRERASGLEFLGLLLGVVELLLSLAGIQHTLVDEIGTAVDSLHDRGPRELPQQEEQHGESHEHPEDEAEVRCEEFH